MDTFLHFLQHVGFGLCFTVVWLLCVGGVLLSCLSFSGTWLVVASALLAAPLTGPGFPGWVTVLVFIALSAAVELMEWFAASWGVERRGGSKLAGFMALVGGILGIFAGAMIPIPIVGSLVGMLVFSFALVFLVERQRLQKDSAAAHIAMGAVMARVMVVILKVGMTLAMIAWLIIGMIK
ncbi:MAG: DUF456 domain-containing protein [Lentisphaerota bacterium]